MRTAQAKPHDTGGGHHVDVRPAGLPGTVAAACRPSGTARSAGPVQTGIVDSVGER
jgi:hypothetical protein